MTPDRELLRHYAENGDDAAFTTVVSRHMNLVYSAALRQVSGQTQLAEEVTQGVFIELSRQARALSRHACLTGWLYTTTRFLALKTMRSENRRAIREKEFSLMNEPAPTPPADWSRLSALLDEAVCQLNARDREAVLLRFFEGKSHREIGDRLGLSENSARMRVERALHKLRAGFSKRGVAVSAGLLSTIIGEHSVKAAPVGLVEKVALVAVAEGGATGGVMLNFFLMSTKIKLLAAGAVFVVIAVTLALCWPQRAPNAAAAKRAFAASEPMPAKIQPIAIKVVKSAVAPPAKPVAMPNNTAAVEQFVAAPQADLKATITTAIHFLEVQDPLSVLKTLMQPDSLAKMLKGKGAVSAADYDVIISKDPELTDMMSQMREILPIIQEQTPNDISPDGQRVTYQLNTPLFGNRNVEFIDTDGVWHIHFP